MCSIAGARARALRASTMTAAFLMIVTGYLGSQVLDSGRSTVALVDAVLPAVAPAGTIHR